MTKANSSCNLSLYDQDEHYISPRHCLGKMMQNVQETLVSSGRRNNAWLERADSIWQAMKAYWDEARNAERLDSTLSPEDSQAKIDAMSYDSAPDYLRVLQDERDAILRADQVKQNGSPMKENVQHTWQQFQQQERWGLPERPKENPPTRACAATGTTDIESAGNVVSSTSTDEPLAPIVSLKAESIMIFMKMFPTSFTIYFNLSDSASEAEYTKGQVDWQHLVKAMADAGFASTNCGGSIVSFSNAEQSIIFHRLHPTAKLSRFNLLSMGKRLNKTFGWERESFVSKMSR